MPSRNSEALQALRDAAAGWARAAQHPSPLQAAAANLRSWLESRPDLVPPIPWERLDRTRPVTAGLRVLLEGDSEPLYVRLRLLSGQTGASWLPNDPTAEHLGRINPVEILWHEAPDVRRYRCNAAAFLRAAACGDADALVPLLERVGLEAAAALVKQYADEDGLYEEGAGRAPRACPSPRRLLLEAFKGRDSDLLWLEELADGGEDWDSGADALPVPRGPAPPPQSNLSPAEWILLA